MSKHLTTIWIIALACVAKGDDRPNILWITCEYISPYLGSYDCAEAQTPNLDRLAEQGIRYTRAFSNSPVCAVARSTLLTGMYSSTIGTLQMRSYVELPSSIPAFPKFLRKFGYYCTNTSKTDYNSRFIHDSNRLPEYLDLMTDSNPVARYYGAYALFLVRVSDAKVETALMEMIANDAIAANRIMAAQALGRCGDADAAYLALSNEAKVTESGYVFLLAINAFRYAHVDDRLTLEDWKTFQGKELLEGSTDDAYGLDYANRIIEDSIGRWPDRRPVD